MGKRILVQRRGRGTPTYRAPTVGKIAPARYPPLPPDKTVKGVVTAIVHETGRPTPLARVKFGGGLVAYVPAASGLALGKEIELGPNAATEAGNILPLSAIPEGSQISNVEIRSGDGGRIARSTGTYALLFSHKGDEAVVKLPSGKLVTLSSNCRATIGVIAGGGRTEKPFLKAGARYYAMKARGLLGVWPRVGGVSMAALHHPHGGGRHKRPGGPTSVSRTAPPGRKVGMIAPRKTGRSRVKRQGVA